jgi:MioC protein
MKNLPFHLIVGSQMGAAEYIADELALEIVKLGHHATVHEQPHIEDIPQKNAYWLICTSTHGAGELPDNIQPFITKLTQLAPNLADITYGVIALGDRSYDTFCHAGHQVDAVLANLGGQKRGDLLEINVLDNNLPEDYALKWLPLWLNSL